MRGPRRSDVVIRHSPDGLEVMVTDDGCGLPAAPAPGSAGLGLLGMRGEGVRVGAGGSR